MAKAVEKVSGDRSTWLAVHVVWSADHHLVPNWLLQVGGAPPWPYKYPPTVEMRRHTPRFRDSTCKALILSVVARCSLVRRVAGLWGPIGSPPHSSSAEALLESVRAQWSFLSSSRSIAGALSEFCEFWQGANSWVPLVYWDSGLSGYPRQYLRVDDSPIIVSYPITSLILFVLLHIVW
jgi:hypothetical protein